MDCIQLSLFGKTYQEYSAPTEEKISEPCWKNLPAWNSQTLQFLDLRVGGADGTKPEQSPETDGLWHGDSSMLNIGESPSVESESLLSQILEVNAPEKYYLSKRACQGILTRASRRGKALPDLLKTALVEMIEWWENEPSASAETQLTERRIRTDRGAKENESFTVNTVDRHAVAYASIVQPIPIQDKTGTLSPGAHAGSYNGQDAYNDMLVRCRIIDAMPFDTTQITSPQNGIRPCWGDPCHPLAASAYTPSSVVKVYDARGNGNGKVVPTITGDHESGITDYTAAESEDCLTPWDNQARRIYSENGTFPALAAREKAGQNQQSVLTENEIRWIVRRLMPTECERLQGYPDGWTDIGEWTDTKGKRHKAADSPRYKALGNSIALPQWFWIAQKMRPYLKEKPTLGSLFDGIGGFPLVWQETYGNGTARWASEIESFCVAVTKRRFGEE